METSRFNFGTSVPGCLSANFMNRNLIALFLLLTGIVTVKANELYPRTSIKEVNVYLNQARITRTSQISLPAGITTLVFENLSPYMNFNSLQVRSDQEITLLSVTQRINHLKAEQKTPEILRLEDSIESISYQLSSIKIKRESFTIEKDVLNANKQLFGANNGLQIDDLEDALALFRKRSLEIGEELQKLTRLEKPLMLQLENFKKQLMELRTKPQNPTEILVTVESNKAIDQANLELTYLTGNVSWNVFYDVRVKDTRTPLQLITKAQIVQQTGEDWNDVKLILSTLTPMEGGSLPELEPVRIGFQEAAQIITNNKKSRIMGVPASADQMEAMSAPQVDVMETDIQIEFKIANAYTIPADGKPHQVDLHASEIPASYSHAAVPKYNPATFTTAAVAASGLLNVLPGEAHIYLNGAFTGNTYIQPVTEDSLILSLGIDKRIQVNRTLLKEFSSRTCCFGGNKKDVSTWEIAIRNTRKERITLKVEDQIPVSVDKDIVVTLLEKGDAAFDETTGKLKWLVTLEPEQSLKLQFSFEVKYPKNKQVTPY